MLSHLFSFSACAGIFYGAFGSDFVLRLLEFVESLQNVDLINYFSYSVHMIIFLICLQS
jgi:hypothetical protein